MEEEKWMTEEHLEWIKHISNTGMHAKSRWRELKQKKEVNTANNQMIELFLDTNIFLHCKPVHEIHWNKVTGANGEIRLLVTLAVVEELDKRKIDSNKSKARRAKDALKFLESKFSEAELSSNLRIKIFDEASLHANNQDRAWVDDYLIQTVRAYNEAKKSQAKMVTQDSSMKMKCLARGVEVYIMPEEFLLENEEDEQAKEIKKLQKEVNQLKNSTPKISFSFAGQSTFYETKLEALDFPRYCDEVVWEVRNENWMHENITTYQPRTVTHYASQYNRKLQEWLNRYHQFLQKHEAEIIRSQTFLQLDFELVNSGTCPANGLEIELSFPDFLYADVKKYQFDAEPPEMPVKPGTQTFRDIPSYLRGLNPKALEQSLVKRDEEPWVDRDKSSLIRFSLKDLMHKRPIKLDSIFVSFEEFEAIKGFSIEYKIYAKNISEPIEGQLNVRVANEGGQ